MFFYSEKSAAGYIVEPTKILKIAYKNARSEHLTIHSLLCLFKIFSEWLSLPNSITAQIANHKPSGTEDKYYILRPIEFFKWHVEYENWLLQQANLNLSIL